MDRRKRAGRPRGCQMKNVVRNRVSLPGRGEHIAVRDGVRWCRLSLRRALNPQLKTDRCADVRFDVASVSEIPIQHQRRGEDGFVRHTHQPHGGDRRRRLRLTATTLRPVARSMVASPASRVSDREQPGLVGTCLVTMNRLTGKVMTAHQIVTATGRRRSRDPQTGTRDNQHAERTPDEPGG